MTYPTRPKNPLRVPIVVGLAVGVAVTLGAMGHGRTGHMTEAGAFCVATAAATEGMEPPTVAVSDPELCVQSFEALPEDVQDDLVASLAAGQ